MLVPTLVYSWSGWTESNIMVYYQLSCAGFFNVQIVCVERRLALIRVLGKCHFRRDWNITTVKVSHLMKERQVIL